MEKEYFVHKVYPYLYHYIDYPNLVPTKEEVLYIDNKGQRYVQFNKGQMIPQDVYDLIFGQDFVTQPEIIIEVEEVKPLITEESREELIEEIEEILEEIKEEEELLEEVKEEITELELESKPKSLKKVKK